MERSLMIKKYLILGMLLLCLCSVGAQVTCSFTHYSTEDGLSQNTVMNILQDRKGYMWFTTWDGLNKFDGYSFTTYKAKPDNQVELINNRVDFMYEDPYGLLWLQAYDDRVFRFNPQTEVFERVPQAGHEGYSQQISSIEVLPSGVVWLLTKQNGAIRIQTDPETLNFTSTWYSNNTGLIAATLVNHVFEDSEKNEWLMTDNGLVMVSADGKQEPTDFFVDMSPHDDKAKQAFYAAHEWGQYIYFGSDKGRVWCYDKTDQQFSLIQLPGESRLVDIGHLADGTLVFATLNDGFTLYQPATDSQEHYGIGQLYDSPVYSIYIDDYQNIWFEQYTSGYIARFNTRTKRIKRESLVVEPTSTDRSRPAFHIHEDLYHHLWVHPYGGGFSYYDPGQDCLLPFFNATEDPNRRFSNKIHAAFSDRQGNLWMCTHSKGLEKITFLQEPFHLITPSSKDDESLSNEVRALCQDSNGHIWAGIKDGMLRLYSTEGKELGYLTESGIVAHSGKPMEGNAYFVLEDSHRNIWIATKGDGVVKAEPQSPFRYKLTRYRYNKDDIYSLSNNDVYCIYEDSKGRIWVATFAGGVNYLTCDKEGKELFISHRNHLKGFPIDNCFKVRFITGDGQGHIWIGTTVGALMVDEDFENPENAVFHHYLRIPDDESSLSNNDVHWIIPTKKHELYIATFGGGLNKLLSLDEHQQATFQTYTMSDGLPSDILLSIQEARDGSLWISTENGISKFIPESGRFENYQDKRFGSHIRFSEAASTYTDTGVMAFGSAQGIFYFHPDSISKSRFVPSLVFSQLRVENQTVTPGEHSLLKQILDDTQTLELSHRENIFSIQYAALDYTAPADIQYAYMLEGFEKNWNYVGKQRTATYTNLPQGDYVFKVRSTNSDGQWTDNVRSLPITVLPSFWETPWAYFLYVLFILLFIVTAVYILFMIYRLKHKVSMEQQLTNMKLRFFTDISHELRTPLTLIAGPVENVLTHKDLPDETREQLQVVERNTKRMLHLVNQILDFRKIQNKKMKMRVQRVNIVAFTRRIMDNFNGLADEHQIDFLFETEKSELYLWVDADKYEKIVFNLLSNAFKYTPNGKMISVFIHENEKSILVGVRDQGIGIAENRRKSIFMRFENLIENNLFNQSSTGIGLSLVRELVEMHKAVITVDSTLGKGSCFCVEFRKGKEHYDETVDFLQDDISVDPATLSTGNPETSTESPDTSLTDASRPMMLVVEDNQELRLFLRSIFAKDYRIAEASDGVEGLEKAGALLPDIIISDIMMPGKDGITLTRELRANLTTSHIPIILLTAKTSLESQLEGLEYGADDYITKPFSSTYLKARVKNLHVQRLKLQNLYRDQLMQASSAPEKTAHEAVEEAQPEAPEMSPTDRKFMEKLMGLMEKNLDNGDLLVDDLVRELAVSRSVFFKKLKTLTGLPPVEFIKEVRIRRAIQLIETGEYNVTQVAYMTGFNDPRYFSKCFKQKVGMTPTEYFDKSKRKRPE